MGDELPICRLLVPRFRSVDSALSTIAGNSLRSSIIEGTRARQSQAIRAADGAVLMLSYCWSWLYAFFRPAVRLLTLR